MKVVWRGEEVCSEADDLRGLSFDTDQNKKSLFTDALATNEEMLSTWLAVVSTKVNGSQKKIFV